MKTKFETIQSKVETIASERFAWARGVKDYALELLENLESNPSLIDEFNDGMPIPSACLGASLPPCIACG